MNRQNNSHFASGICIPHTRGDEPYVDWIKGGADLVFPTRVGMNRPVRNSITTLPRIPHTRGDEPIGFAQWNSAQKYSPHAWG